MMDKGSKEWRNLTFSQREDKALLPEPLQAGELTTKFRNRVWRFFETTIARCYEMDDNPQVWLGRERTDFWENCFLDYHFNILDIPHDSISDADEISVRNWVRTVVLEKDSHEVLTVLEYILRFPNMPEDWTEDIKRCFEFAPYAIDQSSEPVCIVATTSKEMKESVVRSLANINQSELTGAKSHFRDATQALNNNNFAGSIRESIHAVEAAARKIDPESSKGLGAALNSLENRGMLKHSALAEGFKKLYGYTSDEEGIRHPLIDSEAANVGFDEAIFMYGACVSFVDYLVSKHRQLEEMSADNEPRESSFRGDEG